MDEGFDGIWAGEAADESLYGAGYPLWALLRFFEFFSHKAKGGPKHRQGDHLFSPPAPEQQGGRILDRFHGRKGLPSVAHYMVMP